MVSSQNHTQIPVDVWERLHTLFEGDSEQNPEIHLVDVAPEEMGDCVIYMLEHSRDVISRFVIPGTEIAIIMPSPQAAVSALSKGTASAAFWLGLPALPSVGIYVDDPHMLSVSYVRGEWSALSVLSLLDLLYHLTILAPSAEVLPDAFCFSEQERMRFTQVFRQYHNATD